MGVLLNAAAVGRETPVDVVQTLATSGLSVLAQRRAETLAGAGCNSYELAYKYIADGVYTYQNVIDYCAAARMPLIRCLWPVFFGAEYASYVFASGIPSREFEDSDFRPAFLARSDEIFTAAATAKQRLLITLFWHSEETTTLCGETLVNGIKTTSATFVFMARLTRWFGKRYGNHPALGAFSFFNEPNWDVAGASAPTPANLGAVNTALTNILRPLAPRAVATVDLCLLPLQGVASRPTFDSEAENIRTIAAAADTLGLHIYGDGPTTGGFSFVGMTKADGAAYGPTTSNDLGYEGLASYLSAARALAASMGTPLWVNEINVNADIESATVLRRKQAVLRVCMLYAQVVLLWNVADLASPPADQVQCQIRPGQPLGDAWLPALKAANAGPVSPAPDVGAGIASLLLKRRPRYCFTGNPSSGAGTVRVTSTAAMAGSTTALLWKLCKNGTPANFTKMFDLRAPDNTSGLCISAASPGDGVHNDFVSFFSSGGTEAFNTAGQLPADAAGSWGSFALLYRTVGGQSTLELWRNGMFWRAMPASGYNPMPAGTTLYIAGGQTAGAGVSLQDFCLAPYVSPEDIWAWMDGAVLPQATLHLRASPVGIKDLSASSVAVTIGPGVTYGVA